MADYRLQVDIDAPILRLLTEEGYGLCCTICVDAPNPTYNVASFVVPSTILTGSNVIEWTMTYTMFATTQPFMPGNVIEPGNAPALSIQPGQTYLLNSWSEPPSITSSPCVPTNSLGFRTGDNVDASAVITVGATGTANRIPMYISQLSVPQSISIFTPVPTVTLWFQQNVEASMMIVLATSFTHAVDFTTTRSRTTTMHNNSTWTDSSDTRIDFTKVTPAFVGVKKKQ